MHFWIDKRSQTCGFNGRRSLSVGCGTRRPRRKPMVTPVHRFTPIECGRRALPPAYSGPPNLRQPGPHAVELDSSVFLDLPLDNAGETISHSNGQQQQRLPVGRLKCGMWATFALATVFVAGAKFYYDHQGTGLDVIVFCALLVAFLLAGCSVSLCRSKVTWDMLSTAVTDPGNTPAPQQIPSSSGQSRELEMVQNHHQEVEHPPGAVIFTSPPPPQPAPEPPPPPYHIAILLPQQTTQVSDESPPPSYEKAVS